MRTVRQSMSAVAVLQAVFFVIACLFYRQFWYELGMIAGVVLLMPLVGIIGGVGLAYWFGRNNRRAFIAILASCVLTAPLTYHVGGKLGKPIGTARYFRQMDRAREQDMQEQLMRYEWLHHLADQRDRTIQAASQQPPRFWLLVSDDAADSHLVQGMASQEPPIVEAVVALQHIEQALAASDDPAIQQMAGSQPVKLKFWRDRPDDDLFSRFRTTSRT